MLGRSRKHLGWTNMSNAPRRNTFPNMVSLIRHAVWHDGVDRIERDALGITTVKARAAAQTLAKEGLITIDEEGSLLIIKPVPGRQLDRQAFHDEPEDVEAWV